MKKKIYKALITTLGVICCSMCFLATPAATIRSEAAVAEPGISPNQAIKRWAYKEENGAIWKRLWNCSTVEWEGEWIFVRYV